MNTTGKYILKGKKVVECNDLFNWGKWFETADRIVKQEHLLNGYYVSTVFLGIDHNYNRVITGKGKPILFETMVFDHLFESSDDLHQERYSTWKEAMQGHIRIKKEYQNKDLLNRIPVYLFVIIIKILNKLMRRIYGKLRKTNKRA